LACVGAGIGGGFINTNELHVMNYQEAMKTPDKAYWKAAVDEEYQRMLKYIQAMYQTMTYLLQTEKIGLVLKPNASCLW
jgi:hypothetical protein